MGAVQIAPQEHGPDFAEQSVGSLVPPIMVDAEQREAADDAASEEAAGWAQLVASCIGASGR